MKHFEYDVFRKNEKGKFEKTNRMRTEGIHILQDMLNYNERKVDGERIKIVKHYNYTDKMNIDVYFNNGWKYTYYDIPCTSGAYIDTQSLLGNNTY